MFKVRARRLSGAACAVTLAVLLTGNVAAVQLDREDRGDAVLVTPRHNQLIASSQWMTFKLATTAGYRVLVFG
jgi:hypothetical protein